MMQIYVDFRCKYTYVSNAVIRRWPSLGARRALDNSWEKGLDRLCRLYSFIKNIWSAGLRFPMIFLPLRVIRIRKRMITPLVILAATMGNRYGGLKYLDGIGPHGETILDYSVYDAIKAGFRRIVFVINPSFETAFKENISSKYASVVDVDYVYQDVTDVAQELRSPKRTLLWGSAHALLRGREQLDGAPFGVINAVNFYQRESFELLYQGLQRLASTSDDAFLVGYKLANVMPESGGANRGICQLDSDGRLLRVDELSGVERVGGHPMYKDAGNCWVNLDEDACVSMNMWGFTPRVFAPLAAGFDRFIREHGHDAKRAYILPDFVNELIAGGACVKNVPTEAQWMGLVSPDDKIQALLRINELIRKGVYPSRLFAESNM